jgi:RNA polymerase sigma-70 factor (ECF subfamily)
MSTETEGMEMQANPDTRESLILRLPTAADAEAWREFVDIYEPLVLRFAKSKGLQDADAREVAQNVFLSVARAVERWQPDPERGRFRAWLFRIARNQLLHWISKRNTRPTLHGYASSPSWEFEDPCQPLNEEIELEYRREMFRLAAMQVRNAFSEQSWTAFWRTSVLDEPVQQVASQLGMSVGAIYIARSRVTARLRATIEAWENEHVI